MRVEEFRVIARSLGELLRANCGELEYVLVVGADGDKGTMVTNVLERDRIAEVLEMISEAMREGKGTIENRSGGAGVAN
jgi:hypothetical protein